MALFFALLCLHGIVLPQNNGIRLMPGSTVNAETASVITIYDGGFVNDGSFIAQSESNIIFNGNSVREMGGATPTVFSNLTVNNTAGLRIAGALVSVKRVLLCNGLLETNGRLTLQSGGDGTALIDGAGTGTVSGNVTMQRYLPSGFGYKYFSSPFTSSTVNQFTDEAIESIYRYDENRYVSGIPVSGWTNYSMPDNLLMPMTGYAVNLGTDSQHITMDIIGEVSNGEMSLAVYNNGQEYTTGFNLVGNPYPSPVDWNRINLLNSNIDDAVYYFSSSAGDQYGGSYITYINGISSDGRANNIIPSMQAFFIHVSDGSYPVEGRLAMNNSVRINDLDHAFIKSAETESPALLRLTASFSDNPETPDHTVIYFDERATPEFDGQHDALKLMNTDYLVPNLFSLTPSHTRLSISGVPPPGGRSLLVALGVLTQKDGTVKLKASSIDASLAGMTIHLIDSVAGVRREMSLNSEYTLYLKAGDHSGRFYLKFAETTTGISRQQADPGILEAVCSGGSLRVNINRLDGTSGNVRILDLSGRVLQEITVHETGWHEFKAGRDTGIYIISYQTGGIFVSRKVAMIR